MNAGLPLIYTGAPHSDTRLIPAGLVRAQQIDELEADRFGVELAARTGYDATAFIRYLERTLPSLDSRLSLRELVAALPAPTRPSSTQEFRSLQETVRSLVERVDTDAPPRLKR